MVYYFFMLPFIGWLSVLIVLGCVLGTFAAEPLGISAHPWVSFLVSFGLGAGLTWLGQRTGFVSRLWFRRDR